MDRYRNLRAEELNAKQNRAQQEKYPSDDDASRRKPRENHPDAVSSDKRMKKNLNKLNEELSLVPKKAEEELLPTEDTGAKVVTRKAAVKAPVPVAIILCSILITSVFMYMLSLYVQIQECNQSIASLQSTIAQKKEESTRLEVQIESKYDLDEIERIATEEYGMVSADSLPKRYISVTSGEDVAEAIGEGAEESGISKLLSGFASAIRDLLE